MATNFRIFSNLFSDPNIIPSRFLNFCMFVYDAMENANVDGKYDADMGKVKTIIDSMDTEINEVDNNLNSQVNNTTNVDTLIYSFGQFMKNNSGAIAYALGGSATAAFNEFYPHKNREYLKANKTTMPKLSARVATLSKKYAGKLGERLAGDLAAFSPAYKALLTAQRRQITTVKTDRSERNSAFASGQWALTGVVHSVAGINNGKPDESEKLFPFTMLYPHNGQHPMYLRGNLAVGETKELMNRTLTADVSVDVKNTSINARMMIWLALTPDAPAPETGMVIDAGKRISVTADQLGNLDGTFLMVKNLSDVNSASFVIGILGIKKVGKTEDGNVKSISLKIAS